MSNVAGTSSAGARCLPKPQDLPLAPVCVHPRRSGTIVWASDKFVFAFNTETGVWEGNRKEAHTEPVRALDAMIDSKSEITRWVTSGDDKDVIVWEEKNDNSWTLLAKMKHSKKVTRALFDANGNVVLGDRFGEVSRWEVKAGTSSDAAELMYNHLAIVTCLVFAEGGRYIISGDNHEKIRVSRYPDATVIRSFCLGHTAQITGIAPLGNNLFASSASCGELRVWNFDGDTVATHRMGTTIACLAGVGGGDKGKYSNTGAFLVAGTVENPSIGSADKGLRVIRVEDNGKKIVPEKESLSSYAVQCVAVRGNSGAPKAVAKAVEEDVFAIDLCGHLRFSQKSEAKDIFDGGDAAPASLASLSKYAQFYADAGAEEGGDVAEQPPRKKFAK